MWASGLAEVALAGGRRGCVSGFGTQPHVYGFESKELLLSVPRHGDDKVPGSGFRARVSGCRVSPRTAYSRRAGMRLRAPRATEVFHREEFTEARQTKP